MAKQTAVRITLDKVVIVYCEEKDLQSVEAKMGEELDRSVNWSIIPEHAQVVVIHMENESDGKD
jgi:polyhydroxyalkanoate synthesis regulator protein